MRYDEKQKLIFYGPEHNVPEELAHAREKGETTVKASLAALIRLNAAGLPVPDPLMHYDWPCAPGGQPFPPQRKMTRFMILNPRSFVLSDMRTGKTRAALWAIDFLLRRMPRAKVLVVADLNALLDTWVNEIDTHFLGRLRYAVLHGTLKERLKALDSDANVYLINHDGLRLGYSVNKRHTGLTKALSEREDIKLCCFDEAATYRNPRSLLSRSAALISKSASFVWAMTGTPTPNSVLDAYGVKKLVHPDFDCSYYAWREQTTYQVSAFKRVARPDAVNKTSQLLSPAIRCTQSECFELTDFQTRMIHAPLTDAQRELMKRLKKQLYAHMDGGGQIDAVNAAALQIKLLQIAAGAVYDPEGEAIRVDAKHRLDIYTTIVERSPVKIVTFVPFVGVANMLHDTLPDKSLLFKADGKKSEKCEVIARFRSDPDIKTLISHPQPIARGIDLSCASVVLWYAPVYRTEFYSQGNERINGVNQTRRRVVLTMSSSIVEDAIYEKLQANEATMNAILKLKEMHL